MSGSHSKNLNLPWHQYDHYWVAVFSDDDSFSDPLSDALQDAGLVDQDDGRMAVKTSSQWNDTWQQVYAILQEHASGQDIKAAVAPGSNLPEDVDWKEPEKIEKIAQSLWLGDALKEGRVVCYLQPVLSAKDKVFGYESFARVKTEDGKVIAGGEIMAASREMNIEFMIDRLLHVQAIHTFAASDFTGFLFVNFFPGFIHRPAVYLEGLSETAKQHGIIAKHIVLDFTQSESQHDMTHLKSVCEYCRSRGYSIALDDIQSLDGAQKLLPEIRPDFVKIDMHLAHQVDDPAKRVLIKDIVDMVHATGGTVIAEGVETEDMYKQLAGLGVDLFQGYLFSPPLPVEDVLKKTVQTG